LRLKIAQVNILTKRDLIVDKLRNILEWSSSALSLESSLDNENDAEYSLLSKDLVRSMSKGGFLQNVIPVSSMTLNGMVNLSAAIARIVSQGEETND
jgi:hypothetical protein